MELSTFHWAFGYFLILSLQVHQLFGQSCIAPQEAVKITDTETPGLSPKTADKRTVEVEAGLDFIQSSEVELDEDLRFGTNPYGAAWQAKNKMPTWDMVQMFLRKIKGLPEKSQDDEKIASGSNRQYKPAWCYHPFQLKELAKVEIKMYKILKQFYSENKKSKAFPALESYLKDIEESSLKVNFTEEQLNGNAIVTDVDEDPFLYIATHPILIYRLIRRFVMDLQPILFHLKFHQDLIIALYENANPRLLVFPEKADFDDALELFNRMQHGNILDTYELAKGKLEDVNTGFQMNALQALEVGTYYLEHGIFDFSVQWLHFALETVKQSPLTKTYIGIKRFFEDIFELAVSEHNSNFKIKMSDRWNHAVFNTAVTIPFEPSMYTRMATTLKPLASQERYKTSWNWAVKANFRRVCAGENLQSEAEKAALKCWYHSANNLYWTIHPLKTELLTLNPPVFQIYDFIGERLIKKIKTSAAPGLERSTVVDRSTATGTKVDSTRTSSQTWLYEDRQSGSFLLPLTLKMELMSGLRIMPPSSSDAYQVASYGPSHHYEAHIDSFEDPRRTIEQGNRITTIMIYLSDVEVGGRTGFPVLGVFANPVKGSVVMWDNLKKNGADRDTRTWHGGCPVVLGIKWITNKWIYYKENAFQFKCTLNSDE